MAKPDRRHLGRPAAIDLPPSVRARLRDEADALLAALAAPRPTSIRLNPFKPVEVPGRPIPWCASGRYLAERPAFTLDPYLHAGAYYVQEASSMLLEQALRQSGVVDRDVLALDLCAAPGGKSTHLASLLGPGSLLVANEPVRARQAALQENLWKHGRESILIGSSPDELDALGAFFDLVVVDAPCSGEGMFRKDAFAREQWSERLVASCARTQSAILDRAWGALRPGGTLIYCTCTWEEAENEAQVVRLQQRGAELLPLALEATWGVETTEGGHRCYPHRLQGEGFFIAVLKRPGAAPARPRNERTPEAHAGTTWLREADRFHTREAHGVVYAVPRGWATAVDHVCAHLRVIAPGLPLAERKGDRWRPHPAAALSIHLDHDVFARLEVDRAGALDFLRGHTMNDAGAEGVRLVRYEGLGLGWLHAAGARWNNGFPNAWRIRMR